MIKDKSNYLTLDGVSVSSMLSPSNTKRMAPCESPCLSQYAVISFLSGVFFLILKCTTLPSYKRTQVMLTGGRFQNEPTWPVTFRLMCSLLPKSGFTSACRIKSAVMYSFDFLIEVSLYILTLLSSDISKQL